MFSLAMMLTADRRLHRDVKHLARISSRIFDASSRPRYCGLAMHDQAQASTFSLLTRMSSLTRSAATNSLKS